MSVASPLLSQVPSQLPALPAPETLPAPQATELAAEEAVRTTEGHRKLSVQEALQAAQAAMIAKKAGKPVKRKLDLDLDDDDAVPDTSKASKAPASASKNAATKKVPKPALKVVPSAAKAPAAAPKASMGKMARVILTNTKCRSYWLVRVTGSSSEGCKTFSYKHTSEKKALAEAKAHCIKVCKKLGAELPEACK